MPSVLFICTANICRSPLAMALWRARVKEAGWRIESAGNWALPGQPAALNTRLVLQTRGLNADDHRARRVDRELVEAFNLILVMENNHAEALRAEFPDLAGRIYLLSEMIGEKFEIRDPYGSKVSEYEATAREFERIFNQGYERILQLAQDSSGEAV